MKKYTIYNSNNQILALDVRKHYHYDFLHKTLSWKNPSDLPAISTEYTINPMLFNTKTDCENFKKWLKNQKIHHCHDYLYEYKDEGYHMNLFSINKEISDYYEVEL